MSTIKQLKSKINNMMNKSLSDGEIHILTPNINVVSYPDIYKYPSIDALLGGRNACYILYCVKEGYGHWCCLTKRNNIVEFFDSYGGYPDTQLKYIPKKYAKNSHQDKEYLLSLLHRSPYIITYNSYKFQKKQKGVNTCGRWCALRVIFRELPLIEFKDMFLGKYSDEIASLMTTKFT